MKQKGKKLSPKPSQHSALRKPPIGRFEATPTPNIKPNAPCARTSGCQSQLIFRGGKQFLRLCIQKRQAGPLIEVTSSAQATKLGKAFCVCATKHGTKPCAEQQAPDAAFGASRKRQRAAVLPLVTLLRKLKR